MQGKVVVMSGAFGALGQAVGQRFAELGARLVLIDKSTKVPVTLESSAGAHAIFLGNVNLADEGEAARAIERAFAETARIDVLINIAGGFCWETVRSGSLATWDLMYRQNLRTAVSLCRAVLPVLTKEGRGRIINVGAGAALRAAVGMGAYAASKAAVHRLTESLAEELKGQVTVNAVLPSILDTPQNRAAMADADFTRWVQPAELASVIAFLASDEAAAVTGALLPVNGRV